VAVASESLLRLTGAVEGRSWRIRSLFNKVVEGQNAEPWPGMRNAVAPPRPGRHRPTKWRSLRW
jgi:hypothetical protein